MTLPWIASCSFSRRSCTFPSTAPTAQLMSYKFHHRRLGIQLLDDKTLADQQVTDGDVLRIQPEITAGGVSSLEPQGT